MGRKQGVILSYVLMLFEVLSTLLITPFLIRTLGQAEYGVYKLTASITAYLLLLDMGMGNATIRYISQYRENKDSESERRYFAVGMLFYLVVAVLTVIGGIFLIKSFPLLFKDGLNTEEIILGQRLLFITVINAAVTMGTSVYSNIIVAYEKFWISKGLSIVSIVLKMILTVVVLELGIGSIGIVCITFFTTILTRGGYVYYVFVKMKLRPILQGIDFHFIKKILMYSSLILIQMIATQINSSIDQIFLGMFIPASASIIAIYSIGMQLVQYFQSIGSAFSGVLMPGVVRIIEKKPSSSMLCDEMVRIGRIIFLVLGLIWSGFLAVGSQFIELWAGMENVDAYYVAIILMTIYLIISTESIGIQMLWAKNEHKEYSFVKLGIVLMNCILTIVLIKWRPLLGATIGTFISLAIGDILIINILFVKKLKISLKKYYMGIFKGLLPCVLITVVLGCAINFIPLPGWVGLSIKIVLIGLIYIVLILLWGMNRYEKNTLKSLFALKTRSGNNHNGTN